MSRGQPFDGELAAWFVEELSGRCLPFTADALDRAANIVRDIMRDRSGDIDQDLKDKAAVLAGRIDAVLPYFRDNGLFCSYAGWPEDWNPAAILGVPRT